MIMQFIANGLINGALLSINLKNHFFASRKK
jgi:hypothetical protein